MNGTSTKAVNVSEAKNSRMPSNSRRLLANAPADDGRASRRRPSTRSYSRDDISTSARLAGHVDETPAQAAQNEIEQVHHGHTDRQHPRASRSPDWHDPVVYVHDEQGLAIANRLINTAASMTSR